MTIRAGGGLTRISSLLAGDATVVLRTPVDAPAHGLDVDDVEKIRGLQRHLQLLAGRAKAPVPQMLVVMDNPQSSVPLGTGAGYERIYVLASDIHNNEVKALKGAVEHEFAHVLRKDALLYVDGPPAGPVSFKAEMETDALAVRTAGTAQNLLRWLIVCSKTQLVGAKGNSTSILSEQERFSAAVKDLSKDGTYYPSMKNRIHQLRTIEKDESLSR